MRAVWTMGVQADPDEAGDIERDKLPTLVLPVDKKVTIDLQSRDVIHSFWIIDFLYKKDMYIGKDNSWSFVPTRVGEYDGKCAELCGEYHSMMLFNVKVVEQDEYDAYLETLREQGNTGDITDAYDRLSNLPGTGASTGSEEEE
jgi:cytochrome c oxidase subunit 2